jgi:hypothetical protein
MKLSNKTIGITRTSNLGPAITNGLLKSGLLEYNWLYRPMQGSPLTSELQLKKA